MSESQISKFPLDLTPDLASHVTHTAHTHPEIPEPDKLTASRTSAHPHATNRRICNLFSAVYLLSSIYPEEGARGPLPVRLAAFARTSQSHAP